VDVLCIVEVMRNSQWKNVDVSNLVAKLKVLSYLFQLKFKGLHRENPTVFIYTGIMLTTDIR
jgi:hypothetical protein